MGAFQLFLCLSVVDSVEVAAEFHVMFAVGTNEFVSCQEILVGHCGEIVDDDLVRFIFSVGRLVVVKVALVFDFFDVMLEERGAFIVRLQIAKQLFIELLKHGANLLFINIALVTS